MMDSYTSKPIHILFSFALVAVGAWLIVQDAIAWRWTGIAALVFAAVTAAWIVIVGFWDARSRYFESAAHVIDAASKTDLEKLAALGFRVDDVPEQIKIDLYEGTRSRHFSLPVSPVKLRPLAAALLEGQPFSEKRWVIDGKLMSSNEFRTLRQAMRQHDLIQPVNEKDNRQGFALTDAGREFMQSLLPCPPPPLEMA